MPQEPRAAEGGGIPPTPRAGPRLHCPEGPAQADILRSWPEAKRRKWFKSLSADEAYALEYDWRFWARPKQLPPRERYLIWLALGGRGMGKTRLGAEYTIAEMQSGRGGGNFSLVGRTHDAAVNIMIEGESGILAHAPPWFRPKWVSTKSQLQWPNGAISQLFGAFEPETFRGYQHSGMWLDETASWEYPESISQLLLGLRLGRSPHGVITTTPRPKKFIRDLMEKQTTIITRGTTYENLHNMAGTFAEEILTQFEGTRMGKQELLAEMLDDCPGALWRRAQLEENRVTRHPKLKRVVVGIDPAATSKVKSNNTGIIVAGIGIDGLFYVLEDATVNAKPHEWAAAAITAYHARQADRIVAEINQGGEMVQATIHVVDPTVAFKAVHATRNKQTRAEPIAALYEQNLVKHVGTFPHLEDEYCTWDPLENMESPDRLDAAVWALTELLGSRKRHGSINLGSGETMVRTSHYKDV